MAVIDPNKINPESWANHLKDAVDSRNKQNVSGKKVTLLSAKGEKMSLQEIVDTTAAQFNALNESFSKNPGLQQQYKETTTKLNDYGNTIIKGREEKYNQFGYRVLRGMAYAIAVVTSLIFGLGIPLFMKLRKMDAEFKREITAFKRAISEQYNNALPQRIDAQIKRIPDVIAQVNGTTDSKRQEGLEKSIESYYSQITDLGNITQFEKDMERSGTFLRIDLRLDEKGRIDKELSIIDTSPQPPYKPKPKEGEVEDFSGDEERKRIQSGADLIDKLIIEGDEAWKHALQVATTQMNLCSIHGPITTLFKMDAAEHFGTWKDQENGMEYNLVLDYTGGEHLPTRLEIQRDPETDKIKKVNVELRGSLDILSYWTDGLDEDRKIIDPEAITVTLKYELTLDEKNRPVISNLQTKIETKI